MMKWLYLLPLIPLLLFIPALAHAQDWSAPVRGSWVRDGKPQAGDVTLSGPGGACEIVVAADEHSAVRQAARFLAEDIRRLSGQRPSVVTSATGRKAAIHLRTLGSGKLPPAAAVDRLRGQWEAYQVFTAPGAVWCVGSNFRSTAYAAYTLSERLGIDPLHHLSGHVPDKRTTLVMKGTSAVFGPPTFRYRGISLGPDVPAEWHARFLETALRLRLNMIAPFAGEDHPYTVQQKASAWGLFYTSNPYDTLLSNPAAFEKSGLAEKRLVKGDYDFVTNRGGVLRYWLGGVIENQSLDAIYPLGLPDINTMHPDARPKVFSDVLQEQVRLVKESTPGKTAPMTLTIGHVALDWLRSGRLEVPDGVTIIWESDVNGRMPDIPDMPGQHRHGVLYHVTTVQGDFTETLSRTISAELRRIVDAGATEYVMADMSDRRAWPLARLVAGIAWDAGTVLAPPEPSARYRNWLATEYPGARSWDGWPPAGPSRQPSPPDPERDRALAVKYAPILRFDEKEPFFPVTVGYAVVRRPGLNAGSTYRLFNFATPDTAAVIEYAIYWDWDIQHLYELEHVWVHVGKDGRVAYVEATAHGKMGSAWPLEELVDGTHPVLYSEPGKHAFASRKEHYTEELKAVLTRNNREQPGTRGLLIVSEFADAITKTPEDDARVKAWLAKRVWTPTFRFTRRFPITGDLLAPWPEARETIIRRVEMWKRRLRDDAVDARPS